MIIEIPSSRCNHTKTEESGFFVSGQDKKARASLSRFALEGSSV
jgi:hypothetical protein